MAADARPWTVGDTQARWNGYLDPATGVLRNLVGAQTWAELQKREADLVEARALELLTRPVPQTFDQDHLQALHRHLFQDVYPWAGEIRTVDMGKSTGPTFLAHTEVPDALGQLRDVLKDVKWLWASSLATAKQTLPALYNIVNTTHPFREGNGRTQRQFFNDLAAGAGFKIDWTSMPKSVNDHASDLARQGDDALMASMFSVMVTERQVAPRSTGLAGFTPPSSGPAQGLSDQNPRLGAGLYRDPNKGRGR